MATPSTATYRLNDGDYAIFDKAKLDPNYFTEFYLRGPNTGTYWRPVEEHSDVPEIQEIIDRWVRGYEVLWNKWVELGRPTGRLKEDDEHRRYDFTHKDKNYIVLIENNPDRPVFWQNHGFIFLPWQLDAYDAPQTTKVLLGGYGSAKSWEEMTANLIRAATLNNFRAVVIAPYSVQSMEIYEQVKILISGTEYDKRFVQGRTPQKPFPRIVVKNDKVGESRIEFYSIQDGFDKILNLSFDCAHIEQAEQIEDIRGLMRVVGSRLRGQVGGRERLGIMTFVANSSLEENIELWDLYDEAIEHPEHVYAKSPTTFDNIYITPRQLKDIERRMGDDPHIKDIALKGARPIGSGEHFPAESIQKSRSSMLDDMMQRGRDAKKDGYKYVVAPKAQVVSWRIPPDPKGTYFMCADPGWSNPPERNSAAIMVFEIGNFPQVPAHLHAFEWVYGNGAPEPWLNAYVDLCLQYNCVNRNVFDSTGLQAGYERWVHGLQDLGPWALNLGGAKKFIALNSAKTLMHRGLFQFPNIPMLFNQMAKYKLPDDKLRQDLVMTVVLAASYLDYLFYGAFIGDPPSVQAKKSEREVFRSREVNHAR